MTHRISSFARETCPLFSAFALFLTGAALPVSATPIDGSIAGDGYGGAKAVQRVQTQFGDNNGVDKGSELNAAYAKVEGGRLVLALTGNLEDNWNKLVLFFDSKSGGQNVLDTDTDYGGTNPVIDRSPFPGDPGMFSKMVGTRFDAGFDADYVLIFRHGYTGSENRLDIDYGVLGGGQSQYLGVMDPTVSVSGSTGVGANATPILVGFNNSNVAGIAAGTGAADPLAAQAVTTGVELSIGLADLGLPGLGDTIMITAFINNSDHNWVSNQFLGGLPDGYGNLGSAGFGTQFDLSLIDGEQYFSVVVPEPASAALFAGLTVLALLAVRRRMR